MGKPGSDPPDFVVVVGGSLQYDWYGVASIFASGLLLGYARMKRFHHPDDSDAQPDESGRNSSGASFVDSWTAER